MGKLIKNNKCLEDGVTEAEVLAKVNALKTELQGKIGRINTLITEINTTLNQKIDKTGGMLTGNLTTKDLIPSTDRIYNLGDAGSLWNHVYANELNFPSRLD